jgi:hypothetical protein
LHYNFDCQFKAFNRQFVLQLKCPIIALDRYFRNFGWPPTKSMILFIKILFLMCFTCNKILLLAFLTSAITQKADAKKLLKVIIARSKNKKIFGKMPKLTSNFLGKN